MQLKKITEKTNNWQNSMSDIAFLLMIFFILTTLWGTSHIMQLNVGGSTQNVFATDLVVVKYDGKVVNLDTQNFVVENLSQNLDIHKKYKIYIDDDVEYQKMIDLLGEFAKANISSLEICTDEIKK